MRHFIVFATIAVGFCASRAPGATIFINEIDYDQPGPLDVQEFVEIAGSAGANLNGYILELVSSSNVVYQTIPLPNFTFPDFTNTGWGFYVLGHPAVAPQYVFPNPDFIHDGAPGGIRLLDPSFSVVHYVSFEGALPGATDIVPAAVSDNNIANGSIGKTGPTSGPNSGFWNFANAPTPHFLNGGQDIVPEPASAIGLLTLGMGAIAGRRLR